MTFSGDGKQTTDFGFGLSSATATAHQLDGKIVAVGADTFHGNDDFALARYNANGSLDTSFSGDGKQRTDFGGFNDGATRVALQGDGKIVVVGSASDGGFFALARYNPDGSLDTSFSGDGKETTFFGAENGANGVAIQGDGKIVVVGYTSENGAHFGAWALARFNANGSLDTSFSGDGKQTTDFGFYFARDDVATGVALQANGKIVAVGFADNCDFALVRYNTDGSLDTSFSGDGRQRTHFASCAVANGVALQGDGKIVAVGQIGGDFALARYNPNGSLDTSFSGDGKQRTDFGGSDGANGVAVKSNGKIVAGGGGGVGIDFALARYNASGSLDTSFSGDGKQTTDFLGGRDGAGGVALVGDGKIVAVGSASGTVSSNIALARYNPDGSLDTTFSGDGRQATNFRGGVGEEANGVALQANGRIVAVGQAGGNDFALARYDPDGSLDPSFSGDGRHTTDFGRGFDGANGVALQGDGKIVAVGGTGSGLSLDDFALARYNPNGSLDTSFSGDGRQTTDFLGAYDGAATGVALQSDGKIIAVGRGGGPPNSDFALARYNPNGSLDTSFSGDGKQTTDFGTFDGAAGMALQANGKIVVIGIGNEHLALARYNPNGSLDTTFSGDGKQTTDFGGVDGANGVAVQADGRIVAVGFARGDSDSDFALARYNPNGSLDTSFSGDGKQTIDFGADSDSATGVTIQGDGKIVAVGRGGPSPRAFALARYNPNGSLDTSFSGDGKQTTDFGDAFFGGARGVALQGDGRIVAVGVGQGPNQTDDFALARYLGG